MVTVKLFGYLKGLSNDVKDGKIEVELEREVTLKELFTLIKEKLGDKVLEILFDDFANFKLKENVIVLHNGKMETNPNKTVRKGDTISIMPFVSGG